MVPSDSLRFPPQDYELLAFPDERHLPRSTADRVYMEQRVMGFLAKHL